MRTNSKVIASLIGLGLGANAVLMAVAQTPAAASATPQTPAQCLVDARALVTKRQA